MNVAILTEGGKNIGLGHMTRCQSLYDAFLENDIEPCLYINKDFGFIEFLKGYKYTIYRLVGS